MNACGDTNSSTSSRMNIQQETDRTIEPINDIDTTIESVDDMDMYTTSLGRSWKLVASVLRAHKELVRGMHYRNFVSPLAVDDLVYMAERLIETQSKFRSEGKPTKVDIGYHYTSTDCVQRIKLDGLLSRPERQAKGIETVHHGSAFGEGVYVASDPFSSASYGQVGLLVVRLPGRAGASASARRGNRFFRGEAGDDSRSGPNFLVLSGANQCLPLLQFSRETMLQDNMHMEFLHQCHLTVQRIVERNMNENQQPVPWLSDWRTHRLSVAQRLERRLSDRRPIPQPPMPNLPSKPKPRTMPFRLEINEPSIGNCSMTTALCPSTHCTGYEKFGTVVVYYMVPARDYSLLSYIPDVDWGQNLVKRLQYAFLCGSIFALADTRNGTKTIRCQIAQNTKLTRTSWTKLVARANRELDKRRVPQGGLLLFGGTTDVSRMKSPPEHRTPPMPRDE